MSYLTQIGSLTIGGGHPIAIQSMTNTDTADVESTFGQIQALVQAGSELVRITVNTVEAAKAVVPIKNKMLKQAVYAPLIGDFHYNGHILLQKFPDMAQALDKYRINPGNVGAGKAHEYNFALMIEIALKYDKPVRIGVNWGSLDQELLTRLMNENAYSGSPKTDKEVLLEAIVQSALESAVMAEKLGLSANRIILSVKTSEVQDVIKAYEMLAQRCSYALHLGLTEAGMGMKGIVASAAALAVLLQQGIGDTIRISLTPEPGASRTQEVEACKLLLQTMGLRQFQPLVTSCPGCGRTENTYFMELTKAVNQYIQNRMPVWKKNYAGIEKLKIAVMGCVVNGPGESAYADIGIMLPGKSEKPVALVYMNGHRQMTLEGEYIEKRFLEILEEFVESKYKT